MSTSFVTASKVLILVLLALSVSSSSFQYSEYSTNAIGWGYNVFGQLGRGYETLNGQPEFVRFPSHYSASELGGSLSSLHFSSLASGKESVIGIQVGTNRVFAWGSNNGSRLGFGSDGSSSTFPFSGMRKNFPTALTISGGTAVTASLVAASDDALFAVLSTGSLATTYSTGYGFPSDHRMHLLQEFPGVVTAYIPTNIAGLSCSGSFCAVWNSTFIYCFSNALDIHLSCSDGLPTVPTLNLTSVSLSVVQNQSAFHLVASNGSHVWGRYDNSNNQFLPTIGTCATATQWCVGLNLWNINPYAPYAPDVLEVLACGLYTLMRTASDICFYSNPFHFILPGINVSKGTFATYFTSLRPTSMACSLYSNFITNATTISNNNNNYLEVLSFGQSEYASLGHSYIFGAATQYPTTSSYNLQTVQLPAQSSSIVMAKMSSTSASPFVLVQNVSDLVAPSVPRQRHILSWGLNDVSQAMTGESSSYVPVTASTLPNFDLFTSDGRSGCTLYGVSESSFIACPLHHRYIGLFHSTTPNWYMPYNAPLAKTSPSAVLSAFAEDGYTMVQLVGMINITVYSNITNTALQIQSVGNYNLPYTLVNFQLANISCGFQTCAAIEYVSGRATGNVLLWGLGNSYAYSGALSFTWPSGSTVWNTSIQISNFDSLAFGSDWMVISDTTQLTFGSFFNSSTPVTVLEGNFIKVSAGDYIAIWMATNGMATVIRSSYVQNSKGSLKVTPLATITSLSNTKDVAAIKSTFFALADTPGGVPLVDQSIYSWSLNSATWPGTSDPASSPVPIFFGSSFEYSTLAHVNKSSPVTDPAVINLPFSGIKPRSLCNYCKGETMLAFIDVATEPSPPIDTTTTVVTSLPSYLPYRTCFGLNTYGACGAEAYISLSLLPFQRFSPLIFSSMTHQNRLYMAASSSPELIGTVFFWGEPNPSASTKPFGLLPNFDGAPVSQSLYMPQKGVHEKARPSMIATPDSIMSSPQIPFNATYVTSYNDVFYLVDRTDGVTVYTCTLNNLTLVSTTVFTHPVSGIFFEPVGVTNTFNVYYNFAGGFGFSTNSTTGVIFNLSPTHDLLVEIFSTTYLTAAVLANSSIFINFPTLNQSWQDAISIFPSASLSNSYANGNSHVIYTTNGGRNVRVVSVDNAYGQLGNGSVYSSGAMPQLVSIVHQVGSSPVKIVASTSNTNYVLLFSGELYTWGINGDANLAGFFSTQHIILSPTLVPWSSYSSSDTTQISDIKTLGETVHITVDVASTCSGTPPSGIPGTTPICIGGVWVVAADPNSGNGSGSIASGDITITSATTIVGNITLPSSSSISLPLPSASNSPLLVIQGCAFIEGTITVTFTPEQLQALEKQGGKTSLALLSADCGVSNGRVQANAGNSCKKIVATPVSQTNANGGYTLSAVFKLDSSKCNVWWIVLVSVLGGIALLVIIVVLLATITPLKDIIRPFAKRNQAQGSL